MKRKIVIMLMAGVMASATLTACGSKEATPAVTETETAEEETPEAEEADVPEEETEAEEEEVEEAESDPNAEFVYITSHEDTNNPLEIEESTMEEVDMSNYELISNFSLYNEKGFCVGNIKKGARPHIVGQNADVFKLDLAQGIFYIKRLETGLVDWTLEEGNETVAEETTPTTDEARLAVVKAALEDAGLEETEETDGFIKETIVFTANDIQNEAELTATRFKEEMGTTQYYIDSAQKDEAYFIVDFYLGQ